MKLINKKIGDLYVQIDAGSEVLFFQSQFNGRVILFVGPTPARTGLRRRHYAGAVSPLSWRFFVLELVMVTCFVASSSCF